MVFDLLSNLFQNFLFYALHLTQSGSFPKPLPAKEEQAYLLRVKHGDTKAADILIEHNLRLVAHIIKKYYSNYKEQEDLISIGTIGLIKAVSTFNCEKGARFATYASKCIENEILMYFRSQKKTLSDVYISDTIDTDKDGNNLTLLDLIADETNIMEDVDLKLQSEKVRILVGRCLTPREKKIIEMRYGLLTQHPLTQREVAKKLAISRSYVSRIEKKALEKLRTEMEKEDKHGRGRSSLDIRETVQRDTL